MVRIANNVVATQLRGQAQDAAANNGVKNAHVQKQNLPQLPNEHARQQNQQPRPQSAGQRNNAPRPNSQSHVTGNNNAQVITTAQKERVENQRQQRVRRPVSAGANAQHTQRKRPRSSSFDVNRDEVRNDDQEVHGKDFDLHAERISSANQKRQDRKQQRRDRQQIKQAGDVKDHRREVKGTRGGLRGR
ncbi:uncharacterized protein SPPG_07071 [Spizellomyces punctatus DAOM BR117]|uniref:Uncharacterized protein n=1 Tax=Spizellomyces punctatus (strain DAOM BR117) TaxID=645134 RepID=A0A0L0H8U4_SPIPD|nr:uncharacterized protein SPPG_07071 [Spizellomyces punctatus DAOM BR117]KNC97602.1 hypothetical protein SPPG_07071 [Spizellomyces punctatus DAOM BR117]|eukprot:XP_016605642.1 hypothetical protein SPPG_07071 [Spizellomyces punctatus DAOM BR117]